MTTLDPRWGFALPDGRHPEALENWRHEQFEPGGAVGFDALMAKLSAGEEVTEDDFYFITIGGGCFDIAPTLARRIGAIHEQGFYGPAGPTNGAHHWVRTPSGVIIDTTHYQFDPSVPVVIAKPGTALYDRYVPYELMTTGEAAQQDLDPANESYRWPAPSWLHRI